MKKSITLMKAAYEAPVTAVMPVVAEGMLCASIDELNIQAEVDQIVNEGYEEVSGDYYGE